jgi:hypothetical protein
MGSFAHDRGLVFILWDSYRRGTVRKAGSSTRSTRIGSPWAKTWRLLVDLLTEQLTKAKTDPATPAGSPILSSFVGDFADEVQPGWPSG